MSALDQPAMDPSAPVEIGRDRITAVDDDGWLARCIRHHC